MPTKFYQSDQQHFSKADKALKKGAAERKKYILMMSYFYFKTFSDT